MINRIFPSSSDFENLSQLRTEVAHEANEFDYSKVVVRKPWGYEYLWFQNSSVAIWLLYLSPGSATSLHCHARKRTSLIVLSGEVDCTTFDNRFRMNSGEAVVLEPCVFHSSQTHAELGSFIMEIETPPLKGDLLRFRDTFGRAGTGYEGVSQYTTDVDQYGYRPLRKIEHHGQSFDFHDVSLRYSTFRCVEDLSTGLVPGGLSIPLLGRIVFGRTVVADIGEAVANCDIPLDKCPPVFPPVELLQIV